MENKYVCSVDIGGTKIATAIMEYPADGSVPHPVLRPRFPPSPRGRRGRLPTYRGVHQAALEANPDVEVLGVGIGAAGVVDPKTGAIAYANEIHGPAGPVLPVGARACGAEASVSRCRW